ncbi:MAG TPA: Asp-tRNA(Asn)/Glu-tRNA(Gln) amidotransferase subunit GatC [Ignavibacteriales bacterium]|nr:Asp-tRNA(Asn)/Glu-tRNA(Gln) amidotransferase subunit GatC [Ignavibacteriales bacterium]
MAVSKKDVEHIAELAKLRFEQNEIEEYTKHLNQILTYVGKLNELNTDNVEPLAYPVENVNVFREDKVKPGVKTADALRNAPDKTEAYFNVPKVINS